MDESGSPQFGRPAPKGRANGYSICAAAVPLLEGPRLTAILPRGSNGEFLKASDYEFTPRLLARFIEEILSTGIDIALVLIDASSEENALTAHQSAALANERRAALGNPPIDERDLIYALAIGEAMRNAWALATTRLGYAAGFVDFVIDAYNLPDHSQMLLRDALATAFEEHGLTTPRVRWASRKAEPLLHAPDLVAAAYRRQARHGDVGEAVALLEAASTSKRIHIQNRFSTPVREEPPSDE